MPPVVLANGRGELGGPLTRDFRAGTSRLVEGNELAIVEAAQFPGEPVAGLSCSCRNDRLVHQVVTEDGCAACATTGNGLPEPRLCVPAFFLAPSVVPGGNVLFAVTGQPRGIEVKPLLFR